MLEEIYLERREEIDKIIKKAIKEVESNRRKLQFKNIKYRKRALF